MLGNQSSLSISITVLAIVLMTVMSCCCICCGVGTGNFVFLDRYTNITTKIVNGSDPWPQPITAGWYSYDESTGKLWLLFPGDLYNNYIGLKVVYGDTAIAHGDSDAGGHIEVSYIHDFPYGARDVRITGADSDGTVHFTFQSKDITLKPGENWTCDAYSEIVDIPGQHGQVKLNVTKVDTFKNYGLFDISRVEGG